jgi:hypothetical protein
MNERKMTSWPLLLIAVALVGAGFSYHLTLDSRFAAIEQKLDENSLALQQYQIAQETALAAKTDTLNNLNKEVDALQTSLEPIGKATREQTDSLSAIHKQIASLEQSQQGEQDAQKKLADYATQLDKIKHDLQLQAAQVPANPAPMPAPAPPVVIAPHAASASILLPLPPRADNAVDLRPAQAPAIVEDASVRALPVALPVSLSASDR